MAGPVKGLRCMWSQLSKGCIINLSAEGFYSVFQCVIENESKGREQSSSFHTPPSFGDGSGWYSCIACQVCPSDTHMERQRSEIPGNAQVGLAIRVSIRKPDDKPELLRLPSVLLLLLYSQRQNASNASKPVKLRVLHLEHGKKKVSSRKTVGWKREGWMSPTWNN